ncbi:hypothetical protein DNTS_013389 [Danionella cerebrum]|uniref:Cytochrome P450 1A n=1 Tax=Danionella cerebrum TaxID=2873325 RepID=A0A553PW79_9TELE|nr:hypothetical protein DNTS_013389 [Danionella translucida]
MHMEFSTSGAALVLCAITLILVALHGRRKYPGRSFPPGPQPWPLVGNLFQMERQIHLSLTKLREQYGDVFQVKLGSMEVVVLSGYSTIKDALVRQADAFAGRPELFSFSAIANGTSMSFSEKYGEAWVLHKKICRNALRTFSQTKPQDSSASCLLEERISAEATYMVETLKEQGQEAGNSGIDPTQLLVTSVANVVCTLCFGKRYAHDDKEFLTIVNVNTEVLRLFAAGSLVDFFPIFQYLPNPALRKMLEFINRMNNFMEHHIQEHLATFDRNCIRDITDALIAMCEDRQEGEESSLLSDSQIVHSVIELFGAGFDTIITGLQWSLLYLIKFPDIQAKIFEEIDSQVGMDRLPQLKDKPSMPYTEAFMFEVFRHASYMPFTIPHSTTEDVTLNGFFIPKDTCVFINQYQVNHDKEIWEDPNLFQPQRFLTLSGHLNKNLSEKVMIFGMGIRRCLGDSVARLEMFMFITTLLHRLHIENVPGQELDLSPLFGLTMKPKPFRIKIVPRN